MSLPPAAPIDSLASAEKPAFLTEGRSSPTELISVLHVVNGEHFSGAERVQDLLAQNLPASGFAAEFVCLKPDRFPQIRTSEVPLHAYGMRHRFDLRPAWRIAQLVRRCGMRLLHAHTPRSALIASLASRITGVPLVYHVHSPTQRDSTRRLQNWMNALNERAAVRNAAALIAVSASLGRFLHEQGYSRERVHVVRNGVPAPGRLRDATAPGPTWTLGTIALFRPRKGLEVLIDALSILRRAGAPVRLRAVGPFETPGYEAAIRARVARRQLGDAIEWVGFSSNVAHELTQMDVFVLPSLFGEGLPMVVLEAMAAGVPVLGTRVEGVPEAISHGESGLLAEPDSAQDLAMQLSSFIAGRHDWQQLRHAALQAHGDRFSDQVMAAGVAEIYRQVLKNC